MTSLLDIKQDLPRSSFYRPELDGLRGLAVLVVVINHFCPGNLPSGYLGVDIFFVISGYVITASLARRKHVNFWAFIRDFYERRIKRLVPALAVYVLIASLFLCLLNPSPQIMIKDGVKGLLGISNIYFYRTSTDYFSESTELNPFTQTWSLGVEEQFYLLFPLLFWIFGYKLRSSRYFLAMLSSLAVLSLASFVVLYDINQPAAYFLMPMRFWEISLGVISYLVIDKVKVNSEIFAGNLTLVAIALAMSILFLLPKTYGVISTILISLISVFLLFFSGKGSKINTVLKHPFLLHLGRISYSLYLWHWGVLTLTRWTLGIHFWLLPIQLLMSWILAILSYKYIEQPIRYIPRFQFRSFLTLVGGPLVLAATSGLVLSLPSYINPFAKSPLPKGGGESWDLIPTMEDCHVHGRLDSILADANEAKLESILSNCTTTNPANQYENRLYIAGNSHAGQLMGLHHLLKGTIDVTSFSVGWCPFLGDEDYTDILRCPVNRQVLQSLYLDYIESTSDSGDIVLIANRFAIKDKSLDVPTPSTWLTESAFSRLQKLALNLKRKNVKLVILAPLPEMKDNVTIELCRSRWYRPWVLKDCLVPKQFLVKERLKDYQLLRKAKQSGVEVIDMFDILCPLDYCSIRSDSNQYLYTDGNHLSDFSVEHYLYPSLLKSGASGWL